MEKFIPREKLSPRKRKEQDKQNRVSWSFSPITRRKESKKHYTRKGKSHDRDMCSWDF